MNVFHRAAAILAACFLVASAATAGTISGAGASFPYPVYAKWASGFQAKTGNNLNYQSIGSGGGIAQIKAGTVTFGASDMPLLPADLGKSNLVQFPTVIGGIVPVINLAGVGNNRLVLNGAVLADIFVGNISRWDDQRIAALNRGMKLPHQAIAVVHRSDGSGTTFVFTSFLAQKSKFWHDEIGASTAVEWPVGLGAKGNEGIASYVSKTAGSIGYVEFAYAEQNKLNCVRLYNRAGKAVTASAATFKSAASGADWAKASTKQFYVLLVDQPGDASWPITATTYILMNRRPRDAGASSLALQFFRWSYANGDEMAAALGYVPLPDNAVTAIEASWKQIAGVK